MLEDLGPGYANCQPRPTQNTCTRREADPWEGCPKCEYQIQRRTFVSEVEEEFQRASPGAWADEQWPFDVVEQAVSVAASAYYDYPKRPNPKWPVTLAFSVSIYRSEVQKMRAADSYRLTQKLKSREAAAKGRRGDLGGLGEE